MYMQSAKTKQKTNMCDVCRPDLDVDFLNSHIVKCMYVHHARAGEKERIFLKPR